MNKAGHFLVDTVWTQVRSWYLPCTRYLNTRFGTGLKGQWAGLLERWRADLVVEYRAVIGSAWMLSKGRVCLKVEFRPRPASVVLKATVAGNRCHFTWIPSVAVESDREYLFLWTSHFYFLCVFSLIDHHYNITWNSRSQTLDFLPAVSPSATSLTNTTLFR